MLIVEMDEDELSEEEVHDDQDDEEDCVPKSKDAAFGMGGKSGPCWTKL